MSFNQTWVPGRTRRQTVTPQGVEFILHRTPVVTVSKCGRAVKLRHGGYRTATTKATINQVFDHLGISAKLYQTAGLWLLQYKGNTTTFVDGGWVAL